MPISFPSTSVNNNVSFFLDFLGMLPRDRATVYRENILKFRDKTDNTVVSIGNTGGGTLQVLQDELYTGTSPGGYLSTTFNSELVLGTNPYTIEMIVMLPTARTAAIAGLLSVNVAADATSWQLGVDNLNRATFQNGTNTTQTSVSTLPVNERRHIAIVRNSTAANDTRIYLNGVLERTFTDDVNYSYAQGLLIGTGRGAANPALQTYIRAMRVTNGTAQYSGASFTPPTSLPYVAIGDTYKYLDKIYKWNGFKWYDRSKYNANIPGEFRNYLKVTANTAATPLDLRSSNFFEIDLVRGTDTSISFQNEASMQSFATRVDQIDLVDEFAINNLTSDGITKDISSSTKTTHITFSSDGKYLFMGESVDFSADVIRRFTLNPTWNIASITTADSSTTTGEFNPGHILLSPSGDRITWSILSGGPATYTNTLTNWTLPASIQTGAVTLALPTTAKQYSANGSALYVADGAVIKKYALSTNWNTSTVNTTSISTSPTFDFTIGSDTSTIQFNSDESRLIVNTGSQLRQYEIPIPGDLASINTAIYVSSTANSGRYFQIKPDGTKLFDFDGNVSYTGLGVVRQFTSTRAFTPPLLTWPSTITWSTGSAPLLTGTTLIEFYKYNGTWHGNVIAENL